MFKCRKCSLLLLGAGVGAAAGLLLAPKSGREIRQELLSGSRENFGEPGTEMGLVEPELEPDLKAKIEETRARLKAELEARQ